MMAYKEVELKVKLSKIAFMELRNRIASLVKPKGVIAQEDYYVDHPAYSFFSTVAHDGQKSLRIRHTNYGDNIVLKVAHKGKNTNDYYRDEYELGIDDAQKMLELFKQLGYVVIKSLKKERAVFAYDEYEITLDEIQGLSPETMYLVEIEAKGQADNHVAAIEQMEEFLRDILQVTEYEKMMHGVEKYVDKQK